MEATTVATPIATKPPKKRINYALAATLLATGARLSEIAERCGAKNANVLKVGLAKKGVTRRYANSLPIAEERVTNVSVRVAAEAIDILRDKLNGRLSGQLEHLARKPVGKLANRGQGEAAVLKTMAETYRALNGAADTVNVIFGVNTLREADPSTIDVQAMVEPSGE